jgi:hypothetical protein
MCNVSAIPPHLLERINSKIVIKITLLVIIEIILVGGSFGLLTYFLSQQASLGCLHIFNQYDALTITGASVDWNNFTISF